MNETKSLRVVLCLLLIFTATAQAQIEEDNARCGAGAFNESGILPQDGARISAIPEDTVVIFMPQDISLPRTFDWRDVNGVNWMTPIRKQRYGACWAFDPIAVMEAVIRIQMNDPTLGIDLSEQYLVSACCDAGDSSGGYPYRALKFMEGGVPLEEEFPYTGRNSACTPSLGWEEKSWGVVDVVIINNNRENIKRALMEYGPLSVTLNCEDLSAESTTSSVVSSSEDEPAISGNHAVALVGYDDSKRHWIVKCSKRGSSCGGEAGYKTVPYGDIEKHDYIQAITGVYKKGGEWTDPVWAWSSTWWGNKVSPRMAIDKDPNTHWFSGSYQSFPKWIFFDMGEIVEMDKVRVMIFPSDLPMEIDIEVTDGTLPTDTYPYSPWEWRTVLSDFTVTEGGVFVEIPFPETVNARYVKLWQTSRNELGRNFGTCTEFDAHVINKEE